jgi:hypothetical protein
VRTALFARYSVIGSVAGALGVLAASVPDLGAVWTGSTRAVPAALGLLQRHSGEDGPGQIGTLLREWETWGSELLESHLSYPMLAYYRSQHNDQSRRWRSLSIAAL